MVNKHKPLNVNLKTTNTLKKHLVLFAFMEQFNKKKIPPVTVLSRTAEKGLNNRERSCHLSPWRGAAAAATSVP